MTSDQIDRVKAAWDIQFRDLFDRLGMEDTRPYVDKYVQPVNIPAKLEHYLLGDMEAEDTSDLAD